MWKHTNAGSRPFGPDVLQQNPATGQYAPGLRESASDRHRPYHADYNPNDTRDISLEAQKKLAEELHLEFRERHGVIAARSLPVDSSPDCVIDTPNGPNPPSPKRHIISDSKVAAGCNLFAAEIRDTTFFGCSFNSTMLKGACIENVSFAGKCSAIGMHLNNAYLRNVDARGLRSMRGGSLQSSIIGLDTSFRGVDLTGVNMTDMRFEFDVGGKTTIVTAKELLQSYEEGTWSDRRKVKRLMYDIFGKCVWGNAEIDPDLKKLLDKISKDFDGKTKYDKILRTSASLVEEMKKSLLFNEGDLIFGPTYSDIRSQKQRKKILINGTDAEIEITFSSSPENKKKGYLENQVSLRALNLDFNHLQKRALMQRYGMFFEGETPDEIADREKRIKAGEDVKAPKSIIRFKEHFTPREAFEVITALVREGYRERRVGPPAPSSTPGPGSGAGPTAAEAAGLPAATHFLAA